MWNTALIAIACLPSVSFEAPDDRVPVKFSVTGFGSAKPLPCRIHLKDAKGDPVRPEKLPFWADHFSCDGAAELLVPPGKFSYQVERGPEFSRQEGAFEAVRGKPVEVSAELRRIADLAAEGWWGGDLHVHRPPQDMELLMKAEDLHVAPVITWWNKTNPWKDTPPPANPLVLIDADRAYHVLAGEDERQGGAFLFLNLRRPLDIARAEKEYPPPLRFLQEARREPGAWIDIEKPFWWDVPTALAHGFGDSLGILNNHAWRSGMLDNEAWGRSRDRKKFLPPAGVGWWSQEIYYHILNCGLRIPPSAGSASGVLPNPVGYNRVYVHIEGPFAWEKWWDDLRAGRCFVTNGPLLRAKAGGRLPGHVFSAGEGESVEVEVQALLDGNDPVSCVEIVKDGATERFVSAEDLARSGTLGKVRFDRSGWFLLRAVAGVQHTFRFASTGPFYVEIGKEKRRVNRRSLRFFADWVRKRMARIDLADPAQREEVLQAHEEAIRYWEDRLKEANAE